MREADSIRVLTLRGEICGTIACTIQEIALSQGVSYQALSYVWDPLVFPCYAVVQDELGVPLGYIPLTTNLDHALRDLWNAEERTEKIFWIDQISIDQGTTSEKNHQVAMMGRIYKCASRVITYLGPAEDMELEMEGIKLLDEVHRHFAPNYSELVRYRNLGAAYRRRCDLPVLDLPRSLATTTRERTWTWLAALSLAKWAHRLWIVREQLLNDKNHAPWTHALILECGSGSACSILLGAPAQVLSRAGSGGKFSGRFQAKECRDCIQDLEITDDGPI